MDIKCERCGTEYEFDDNRVTEEGVTVKCSTCGHLFKVRRKSFVLTEPIPQDALAEDDLAGHNWMVRQIGGAILRFKELTTLQKWIVERRVSRDDEISKSGETWKRLGSIAELASFFQVVDQATQTNPLVTHPPTTQPLPAAEPPAAPPPSLATGGLAQPGTPFAAPPPPTQPTLPSASQPVMPAAPPPPAAPATAEGFDLMPDGAEPDTWNGGFDAVEDDVVEKWKKRGRRKWFAIIPLFGLGVGIGVFYLVEPDKFGGVVDQIVGKSEPELPKLATSRYQSGLKRFLLGSDAELAAAIKDLDSAVSEAGGRFPDARGLLAEAYITRAERAAERLDALEVEAQALDEQLVALQSKAGRQPGAKLQKEIDGLRSEKNALLDRAEVLKSQGKQDMDAARHQIDAAGEVDPDAFAPKRALANYLRVSGADRAQIEVLLKAAAKIKADDPGLLFIDGASLASDPASLDTAVQKLHRAIQLQADAGQPDQLQARYALAKALVGLKRNDDAGTQLEIILKQSPEHERAKTLLARLGRAAASQPEEVAEASQPVSDAGDKQGQPSDEAQPATFDSRLAKADRLHQAGKTVPALQAFEEALALEPTNVDAWTGKGECLLDLGNNAGAVAAFHRALKTNPRYGNAIIGLAEAYKYKRDNASAIKYYKRYLTLHPEGPEAAVARSNLEQLR